MARILRNLRINDVSSVDVGAGRGVRVVLTKRAAPYNKSLTFGKELPAEVEAYLKREFTQAERDDAAASGAALDDGSFPVKTVADLHNAIQAVGRAKDPEKAKAHIKARAAALGATSALPDSWSKRHIPDDSSELLKHANEAIAALDLSVQSILADDAVTEKAAAIAKTYRQFHEHLAGLDGGSQTTESEMTTTVPDALKKLIDEAVAKAVAAKDAEIKAISKLLNIAKMSEKHQAFHDNLSADAKDKFSEMTPEERDAEMEKTKKRAESDPVVKAMQQENADLRKRLEKIEGDSELTIAKSDAKALGMIGEEAGEVLMKARHGDKPAMQKLEAHMVAMTKKLTEAQRTGQIFTEFGKTGKAAVTGADGGSAADELTAKAAEMRKANPNLTEAQAYTKAYLDPANADLKQREIDDRMNKIHRAA